MMTTPPPSRRRNPAVTVRRVQSERKLLNPWAAPLQYGGLHHEYAPRRAIIPPVLPGRLFSSSRIWYGRLTPAPSQAMMQPLVLIAPPLIINAPTQTQREEDYLAQERLAAFFSGRSSPERPRSILSYPDSHLYESLISQLSELEDEDINIQDDREDNTPSAATGNSKEPDEIQISNNTTKCTPTTTKCTVPEPTKDICTNCNKIRKKQSLPLRKCSDKFIPEDLHPKQNNTKSDNSVGVPNPHPRVSKLLSSSENSITKIPNKKEIKQDTADASHKSSPYQKLKALFKSKLIRVGSETYQEILPPTTTVSAVHDNKESSQNRDKESVYQEYEGYVSQLLVSDDNYLLPGKCPPTKSNDFCNLDHGRKWERKEIDAPKEKMLMYQGQRPTIPKTIELPEYDKKSVSKAAIFHSSSMRSDKATQVSPNCLDSSPKLPAVDSSTLDPLRPNSSKDSNKNFVKRHKTFSSRNILDTNKKRTFLTHAKRKKVAKKVPDDQEDGSPQIIVNFDTESSSSGEDETMNRHMSKPHCSVRDECSSIYSSLANSDSFNRNDLNSVYPQFKDKRIKVPSKHNFATPLMMPSYRCGGSSGLGSSGSYSSAEDLPSSGLGSSSISFIEPSFCSSTLTVGSKGSLRFDYSRSWSNLSEFVRMSPERVPISQRPLPPIPTTKRTLPLLPSMKKHLIPWQSQNQNRTALYT